MLENKNVRISTYGNFGRAFSVDAKEGDVKPETVEITLSPKAAQMIFADLQKVLEGKQ